MRTVTVALAAVAAVVLAAAPTAAAPTAAAPTDRVRTEGVDDFPGRGGSDVDIAALKDGAGDVRVVRVALAQTIDRGLLVAKRGEELERELGGVEGLLSKFGYGVCNLYGVHGRLIGEQELGGQGFFTGSDANITDVPSHS